MSCLAVYYVSYLVVLLKPLSQTIQCKISAQRLPHYCRLGAIAAAAAGIFAAIQAGKKRRRRDVLYGFRDISRLLEQSGGEDLTRMFSTGRTVVRFLY